MKKICAIGLAFVMAFLFIIFNQDWTKEVEAATPKTVYNLVIFLNFQDEVSSDLDSDSIFDSVDGTDETQFDVIENTFNGSGYSLSNYYTSVSSGKVNVKTVYLFSRFIGTNQFSFTMPKNRECYAAKSDTNPNGYENIATAQYEFVDAWTSMVQTAINDGRLPKTYDLEDVPWSDLDSDGDGYLDFITVLLSPQTQTNFTSTRQDPLYPCKDTTSKISVTLDNGKKLQSKDYNQWTPNYQTVYHTEDSNINFLSFGTGTHEMGHCFGYKDLYDYNQNYFPVGNMSMMSDVVTFAPQFLLGYEREINGWLNDENIGTILQSGDYTLDPVMDSNQTGTALYRIPMVNSDKVWIYLEYRTFGDAGYNKYDVKQKNFYLKDGTKAPILGASSQSGVVVYIVNKDAAYPTNSHGNPKAFGVEVLGGNPTTNKKRTDAPQVAGDSLTISYYDENQVAVQTDMIITITSISDGKATFNVSSQELDSFERVDESLIKNEKLLNTLKETNPHLLKNGSDSVETFILSKYGISDISFLNLFTFKNLKFVGLTSNNISNVDGLAEFLEKHPDCIVAIDFNYIDLFSLDSDLLENPNVYYGIQSFDLSIVTYTYYINESFRQEKPSDGTDQPYFYIYYEIPGETGVKHYLPHNNLGTVSFPEGTCKIDQFYHFSDKCVYASCGNVVFAPILEMTVQNGYYPYNTSFTIPYYTTFNLADYDISILIDDKVTEYSIDDNILCSKEGKHTATIKLVNKRDSNKVTTSTYNYEVYTDPQSNIKLNGDNYIYLEFGTPFEDPGVTYNDKLTLTTSITYKKQPVLEILKVGSYLITYSVSDTQSVLNYVQRVVVVQDTTPPTITFTNGDEINFDYHNTYDSSDVIIKDNYTPFDNLIIEVVMTYNDDVVTTMENFGTYLITYKATDEKGNMATKTRTIHYGDFTAPTVTLIGEEEIVIAYGTEFSDPGINYSDDYSEKENLEYSKVITYLDRVVTSFAYLGTYTITYTVTDEAGNTTTVTRTVIVQDQTPPTITLTGEATINLTYPQVYQELGYTCEDNCSATEDITVEITMTLNGAPVDQFQKNGTYIITYKAIDEAGNYSTATRTVIVEDKTAPTITLKGDKEVSLAYPGNYQEPGYDYEDDCSPKDKIKVEIVITYNSEVVTEIKELGTYTITYKATDEANNSSNVTRTVIVEDKTAPTITLKGDKEVSLAYPGNYQEAGYDYEDDCSNKENIIFEITITKNNQTVTEIKELGTYTITYKATDEAENTSTVTRTVIVEDKTAPTITLKGDKEVSLVYPGNYQEAGYDYEDDCSPKDKIKVEIVITCNSEVVTEIKELGTYTITYKVTDEAGNSSTVTRTVTVEDKTAPTITLKGDTEITLTYPQVYQEPGYTCEDDCSVEEDIKVEITMTLNGTSVDKFQKNGTYVLTYKAIDEAGNASTTVTRTVIVEDKTAPTITLKGDITITLTYPESYQEPGYTCEDDCSVEEDIKVEITMTLNGTSVDKFQKNGTYVLTYKAIDEAGNASTTVTRTVIIEDKTAPVITLKGDKEVSLVYPGNYQEAGYDYEDDCSNKEAIIFEITITKNNQTVTQIKKLGTYIITYKATDEAGNSSTVTRTVTVEDKTAPVITLGGLPTMCLAYPGNYLEPGYDCYDDCSRPERIEVEIKITKDGKEVTEIKELGTYIITYKATDEAGNSSTVIRTVTVEDQTSPTITLKGDTEITLTYPQVYQEPGYTCEDDCSMEEDIKVEITMTLNGTSVDKFQKNGTYVLTYKAIDEAGNASTTVTRTVIVEDKTAPTITLKGDEEVSLAYPGNYQEPGYDYEDDCSPKDKIKVEIVITYNSEVVTEIKELGTYTITYKVTDEAGNSSTETRTVTVEDKTAPTITLKGDKEVSLAYPGNYQEAGYDYEDDCSNKENIIFEITITKNNQTVTEIKELGTYIITYNATDEVGNSSTVTRTVKVEDKTAPTVTLKGEQNYQGFVYTEQSIDYSDNCDLVDALTVQIMYLNALGQAVENMTNPGEYTVEYAVTDTSGNTTKITRKVTILSPETCVENIPSGVRVSMRYYNINHEEITDIEGLDFYYIEYTFTDEHGNEKVYVKEEGENPNKPSGGDTTEPSENKPSSNQNTTIAIIAVACSAALIVFAVFILIKHKHRMQ